MRSSGKRRSGAPAAPGGSARRPASVLQADRSPPLRGGGDDFARVSVPQRNHELCLTKHLPGLVDEELRHLPDLAFVALEVRANDERLAVLDLTQEAQV